MEVWQDARQWAVDESLNFVSSEVVADRCKRFESISKQLSGFARYLRK